MSGFSSASGFSMRWVNHIIIIVVGALVALAGTACIALLLHRLDSQDRTVTMWVVVYFVFIVASEFIFFGWLNNFWL